ncbi:MAG: hypothetical protein AB8H79_14510 [Myxococcota bacterium]
MPGGGLLEAPFDLDLQGVDDGDVLVTALVDVDGDFYPLPPFSTVTGGATCGDFSGAHIKDLISQELAPVSVARDTTVSGVTIVVARESVRERPAFVFQGGSPIVDKPQVQEDGRAVFSLASTEIQVGRPEGAGVSPFVELEGPYDGTDSCDTSFWVTVFDRNGDGQPDPHPVYGDAAMDAWPRVFLQYLGTLDDDGFLVPSTVGEWAMEAPLFPNDVWFGTVPLNTPTPLTQVDYLWLPFAQGAVDGVAVEPVQPDLDDAESVRQALDRIPSGVWSVTVMNVDGQTWTLPNELARLPSLPGTSSYEPMSQRGALIVE